MSPSALRLGANNPAFRSCEVKPGLSLHHSPTGLRLAVGIVLSVSKINLFSNLNLTRVKSVLYDTIIRNNSREKLSFPSDQLLYQIVDPCNMPLGIMRTLKQEDKRALENPVSTPGEHALQSPHVSVVFFAPAEMAAAVRAFPYQRYHRR